ncbi:MAG: nucleoside hydrolase [Planctomycetota bacterium]
MKRVNCIACWFGLAVAACFGSMPTACAQQSKPRLILDADTANEIDDMYAITRMLKQDQFDVVALTSAQWIHYLAEEDSVGASQRENEALVKLLGREELPTPIGSREPMGKPWGGDEPKDSPACQLIIQEARKATPENKLVVVSLGASTNLASAIRTAPEIAANIKAYLLGFRYDLEREVWNKSSFNIRRDLNAADYLLNCVELDVHVMPANVARPLTFPRDKTFERHRQMGALGDHLTTKWKARFPEFENWVMWDLALVEAILHPEFATSKEVFTPPENVQRVVRLYDSINVQAMRDDYWSVVLPGDAAKTPNESADPDPANGDLGASDSDGNFEPFDPNPGKCDMLVVAAHPDDEGYFGGLLSHYTRFDTRKSFWSV